MMLLLALVAVVIVAAVLSSSSAATALGIPARRVVGNLIFTHAGQTWVLLRVTGPTYARLSTTEKIAWHGRLRAALASIPGESRLFSVYRPIDPQAVVASMIDGVDVGRNPRWAAEALDTLDTLEAAGITTRVHYLAFVLPAAKGNGSPLAMLKAAAAQLTHLLTRTAAPIGRREERAARHLADDLTAPIVDLLGTSRVTPAAPAEIEWLYARNGLRGLCHTEQRGTKTVVVADEPALEEFGPIGPPTELDVPRLAAIGTSVLFEGGGPDDEDRPAHRGYLRIDSERGRTYQSFLVFARMPDVFSYPGGRGEVFAYLDQADPPVDYVVCSTPTNNGAAQTAITNQIRQLAGQYKEYNGDLAGAPDSLTTAIQDMKGELADLLASPSAPELRSTIIVAVGASDLRTLEERVKRVRSFLEANDFRLPRPTGGQGECWAAFMPGAPTPSVAKDYGQYWLPGGLAGCAPFAGTGLGDESGDLLALNMDAGGQPVLFWAGTGPNLDPPEGPKSGSIGVFGRLGAGKSYLMKRIIAAVIAMGGRVCGPDRTPMGEYVELARALKALGHDTQVIELGENTAVNLDPLVVFRGEDRARYGTGFLTLLTGIDPLSPDGCMLDDAVRRVAERDGRLRDVVDELEQAAQRESLPAFAVAAQNVASRIRMHMRGELATLVFGDGPAVRLDADFSVFWAPDLALPSHEAMKDQGQLMPEQVFGRALLYLVTAVSASVAFAERDRFSLVWTDEGYAMDTPQGKELLGRVLRDGRKHNAALLFGSHHPNDLDAELRQLLGSRFLFRMDREAAVAGLRYMGMEPTDDLLDAIEEAHRQVGQCFYRDLRGRLGLVAVTRFRSPELHAAADTSTSTATAPNGNGHRTRRSRVGTP